VRAFVIPVKMQIMRQISRKRHDQDESPSTRPHARVLLAKETRLMQYYEDPDSKAAFPLKSLVVGVFLGLGVFGTGFVSVFGKVSIAGKEASFAAPKLKSKSTEGEHRGALTRLTRREINSKLQQVPVFYATKSSSGLAVLTADNDLGIFFTNPEDAEVFAKSKGANVGVTTLDDVYYTLLERKTKLASYLGGVAGNSDPNAKYVLRLSSTETKNVNEDWKTGHTDDIPLYRVQNLAFSKAEGLEIPLFLNKQDAIASYDRLETDKKKKDAPDIQVTSLKDMISIFGQGGIEGRAIEFYPSIASIEGAAKYSVNQK